MTKYDYLFDVDEQKNFPEKLIRSLRNDVGSRDRCGGERNLSEIIADNLSMNVKKKKKYYSKTTCMTYALHYRKVYVCVRKKKA